MGAAASQLHRLVNEEYHRLKPSHAEVLVLDDLLRFQLAHWEYKLDLGHLGVLYKIDRDGTGRFDLHCLLAFAREMNGKVVDPDPRSIQAVIKGYCEMQLWRRLVVDDGVQRLTQWIMRLVRENHTNSSLVAADADGATTAISMTETRVTNYTAVTSTAAEPWPALALASTAPRELLQRPGMLYLHKSALLNVHKVLASKACNHQECEMMNNTLQRNAESRGLLELSDASLDDWVPEPVVEDYVRGVLTHMRTILSQLDVLQRLLLDGGGMQARGAMTPASKRRSGRARAA